MDDDARQQLRELVATYGPELAEDLRRLRALLRDFCGDCRAEIAVLLAAAQEGIPQELLVLHPDVPRRLLLIRLAERLQSHRAIAEEAAVWAVESWALAFGVTLSETTSHCEASNRAGREPVLPQPVVSPRLLLFESLHPGERRSGSFEVYNVGGAASRINFSCSQDDTWFEVAGVRRVSQAGLWPVEVGVNIDTRGLTSTRSYNGWIEVNLDGVASRVDIQLFFAPSPGKSRTDSEARGATPRAATPSRAATDSGPTRGTSAATVKPAGPRRTVAGILRVGLLVAAFIVVASLVSGIVRGFGELRGSMLTSTPAPDSWGVMVTSTPTPDSLEAYAEWFVNSRRKRDDIGRDFGEALDRAFTQIKAGNTGYSFTTLDALTRDMYLLAEEAQDEVPPQDVNEIHTQFVEALKLAASAQAKTVTGLKQLASGSEEAALATMKVALSEMEGSVSLMDDVNEAWDGLVMSIPDLNLCEP